MTVNDIYKEVLAMIDNYTEDGTEISASENADIEAKVLLFVDTGQKELWKHNKKTDQVKITNKPPTNLLDNADSIEDFSETTYVPSQEGLGGVGSYSIQVNEEANNNATITVQELVGATWTDIVAYTPTTVEGFETFKGNTGSSNNIRIKLEGTYHYLHKNRAFYEYSYVTVPTYEQWVKVDMPTDFNGIDAIVEEFPYAKYAQTQNYKIENYRDFYYSFGYSGEIRITYKPIPPTVTALTDTIALDDVLAKSLVYDVVAKLGFYENPDLVNWAEGRRIESKQDASVNDVPSAEIMENYYG